jgi:hypothetical protein
MRLRELLKEYSYGQIALGIAQMFVAAFVIYAYLVFLLALGGVK